MSKIESLKSSYEKASERVVKQCATIERYRKKLEKLRASTMSSQYLQYDIETTQEDIRRSLKKLGDLEDTRDAWKLKLDKEIEKERFMNDQAPPVIKEFLDRWKASAIAFTQSRYIEYLQFKQKLQSDELEASRDFIENSPGTYYGYLGPDGKLPEDKHNWQFYHNYVQPKKPLEEYLKLNHLDWKGIEQQKKEFAGPLVWEMYTRYTFDEAGRTAWLEYQLEEERKRKMLDMINRVTKVTGSITDASDLKIDPQGNINGLVIGTEGTARLETIDAGGWNIQCYHFRTLVKEVNPRESTNIGR